MSRNAESPGAAIPGLSQNIGTSFVDLAAGTAYDAPRARRRIADALTIYHT
jgi:hypothetical protein